MTGPAPDDPSGGDLPPPTSGPPGGRIFTLEGRPAPGLYLAGWLLSLIGFGGLFIAVQAEPPASAVLALGSLILLGLGLAAAMGYQLLARADRHPSLYRGPSPLLLFGEVLVVSALASAVLGLFGIVDPLRPFGFLAGLLVVAASYLVCIWLFVERSGALSWADMGWPTRSPGLLARSARAASEAIVVMLPATLGVLVLGAIMATILDVEAPQTLPEPSTSAEAGAVALAAALVAPLGEEVFFRGFALTAWLRDLGARSALIRSAVLFAAVHIVNITVEPSEAGRGAAQAVLEFTVILPLGFALGWLFLRRGLVGSVAGHVTYNGILLVLLALAALVPAE